MAAPAALTRLKARPTAALGVFAILAATACWSSGGVLAKEADQPGALLAFWRLVIVSAVFAVVAAATRKRISWLMVRRSLVGGLLFGVNLAVWFEALRATTVGIATVFGALTPVLALAIGAWLLKERVTRLAVACAAAAVGGVVLFVVPGFAATGTTARGPVLAFAAIAIWVAYLFATKRAREGVGTIEYLLCMSAVAAVSLVPFLVLFTREGLRVPDHGWGWIVALAIVPGSIGHGLLAWAQAHVPMSVAGVLLQGEPVGAALAGALVLHEHLGPIQVLGLLVTFTALAVLTRATTTGPAATAPPVAD